MLVSLERGHVASQARVCPVVGSVYVKFMIPSMGSATNRKVFVPRPSKWVFRSRSLVGLYPKFPRTVMSPGVLSCNNHVDPGPSVPFVQNKTPGSVNPVVVVVA